MRERIATVAAVVLAGLLLWLLFAYVFFWHNAPVLGRLLGLDV